MALFYALLAVAAGSLVPLQAGINALLRISLQHPVYAAIANFVVGLALLVAYAAAARLPLPPVGPLALTPWWYWVGGSMGAALVLSGVLLSHRLQPGPAGGAVAAGGGGLLDSPLLRPTWKPDGRCRPHSDDAASARYAASARALVRSPP
jgi:transporter family-2 protein